VQHLLWQLLDGLQIVPDCPEMTIVPAGEFSMGSPSDEAGRQADEGPIRRVSFARPFALAKYEVTREEWQRFAAASGYAMRGCDTTC
jgi:formylglycine-generating enzyme required for sulfatase activity